MSEDGGSLRRGRGDGSAWIYLTLMILIGSSTATAAKMALGELPWSLLPLIRFGAAGLILGPLVARPLLKMFREDAPRLMAAATLCVPVNQSFFLTGTRFAPTSHVGLIYATCPLVVMALAVLLGQERFRRDRLAGILMTLAGVVVIGLGNLLQSGAQGSDFLKGDLLLVGAVCSWGAYLTLNKPLVARHGGVTTLAGTFLVGCVLDLPIALLKSGDWGRLAEVSSSAWMSLAYLTVVASLFGLICQNLALKHVDASQLALIGNASPILTVVWGVLLLGEAITPALLVGGMLTIAGILWAGRSKAVPTPKALPAPLPALPETAAA
ncbi:MAG: DMT family transporter [Isosphaeraceae bacterium]